MTITDKIRALCSLNGMSVTQLEEELGYGNGSLTKKNQDIKAKRVLAIARKFGVSMESLVDDSESIFPNDSPLNGMLSDMQFMSNITTLWNFDLYDRELIYEQIEMRAIKRKSDAKRLAEMAPFVDGTYNTPLLKAAHQNTEITDADEKTHDTELLEAEDGSSNLQ